MCFHEGIQYPYWDVFLRLAAAFINEVFAFLIDHSEQTRLLLHNDKVDHRQIKVLQRYDTMFSIQEEQFAY